KDAPLFLFDADVDRAGAGGFPADVDDVSPRIEHPQPGGDGGLRRGVLPAVAEGVRGDVNDAHHERPVRGKVLELRRGTGLAQDGKRGGCRPGSRGCSEGVHSLLYYLPMMRLMASARVAGSWSCPRTALVTVLAPGLRMPRMDMQRCSHSITTIAPRGLR